MITVQTARGALIASVLTTGAAIIVAQSLALMIYPISSGSSAYISTPIITLITAFPISYFCWKIMLKNHRLTQELQRLVDRDRLTDVATRDYFFARMAEMPDASGVTLMVDIDHFKRVNDTYGHLVGDRVIAEVAGILKASVQPQDIVCRFGGEEFVIFLQGRDRTTGQQAAEAMRGMVEAMYLKFAGEEISVTLSIGGALKDCTEHITVSIQTADAALYAAKEAGRNRTMFRPREGVAHAPREVALAVG